jgi:hypothetical protein
MRVFWYPLGVMLAMLGCAACGPAARTSSADDAAWSRHPVWTGGTDDSGCPYDSRMRRVGDRCVGWRSLCPLSITRGASAAAIRDGFLMLGSERLRERALFLDAKRRRVQYTGPLATPRRRPIMVVLDADRVLVFGGLTDEGRWIDTAEVYERASDVWRPARAPQVTRRGGLVTRLSDGRVLLTGGRKPTGEDDTVGEGRTLAAVEVFDSANGGFEAVADMPHPRADHRALRLRDGRVVIYGGLPEAGPDVFDPRTLAWRSLALSGSDDEPAPESVCSLAEMADGRLVAAAPPDREADEYTYRVFSPSPSGSDLSSGSIRLSSASCPASPPAS